MNKIFNGARIISLLKNLDKRINSPCSIVICGGAAAIVGYGLNRFTGDIDILEPFPKSETFYMSVKELLESSGLDPKSINDGAKGFVDYLSPDFRKRVIPLDAGFENLEVSIISKADFITMKICAWRESDMQDVKSVGITNDDLMIINENLAHLSRCRPDIAHKAHLVLSEIGAQPIPKLKVEDVNSLTELIQFHKECTLKDASLEDIRKWKTAISSGLEPSFLAGLLDKRLFDTQNTPQIGMDL
jgi:hypothetical protein